MAAVSAAPLQPTVVLDPPRRSLWAPAWPRRGYSPGATPASSSSARRAANSNGKSKAASIGEVAIAVAVVAWRRSLGRRHRHLKSMTFSALATVEAETDATTSLVGPESLTSKPVNPTIQADDLERLRRAGPGAVQNYAGLSDGKRKWLKRKAEELGLVVKADKGEISVYVPADELLYGVVPFTFDELGLHDDLVLALLQWQPEPLERATHIQAHSIPKLLKGYDLVIQAETGCGKTFAYLLPAAHEAILRAEANATQTSIANRGFPAAEEDEDDFDAEDNSWVEAKTAKCYRVEAPAGSAGIRPMKRPEEFAPRTGALLRVGDEFMLRDTAGDPLGTQYLLMADGNGWVPWDRQDPKLRFSLTAAEFTVGQRVSALQPMKFGSGDIVQPGAQGTIERVLPMVGVRWDDCQGVKAVDHPRRALRIVKDRSTSSRWARSAPDTLIITSTRELCEQVADTARKLGRLMPESAQREWTVAVAVGAPPGVGKRLKRGNEQWPFPTGDGAPKVLVTTLEFMGYFFHRKHLPLWANVRYVVYDEVDRLVAGPERWFLNRVKTMFLRAQRTEGSHVQSVLVAATMPSQGTRSTRLKIGDWMPAALRALPRPDWLHRQHPMVQQGWQHVPEDFDTKVEMLAEHLKTFVGTSKKRKREFKTQEKTLVFCKDGTTAVRLAEALASKYGYRDIGLFCRKIGNDERRRRLQMFRDGEITLMVSTDLLSRGIDIPDLQHVVQFDFARNVVDHIHRIGRASRAGTRGFVMNFYDDSEQGGRKLAEAIQDVGSQPLDGLFSRNRGFAKGLKRTEAYKQMLLTQGLPLPPHLRAPEDEVERPTPLLADVLSGLDDDAEDEEEDEAETTALATEHDEQGLEEDVDFERKTDEQKDADYVTNVESLRAQEGGEELEEQEAEEEEQEGTTKNGKASSGGPPSLPRTGVEGR